MAKTVADFIWERLQAWGVHRVFGYPGDGMADWLALSQGPKALLILSKSGMRKWPG